MRASGNPPFFSMVKAASFTHMVMSMMATGKPARPTAMAPLPCLDDASALTAAAAALGINLPNMMGLSVTCSTAESLVPDFCATVAQAVPGLVGTHPCPETCDYDCGAAAGDDASGGADAPSPSTTLGVGDMIQQVLSGGSTSVEDLVSEYTSGLVTSLTDTLLGNKNPIIGVFGTALLTANLTTIDEMMGFFDDDAAVAALMNEAVGGIKWDKIQIRPDSEEMTINQILREHFVINVKS